MTLSIYRSPHHRRVRRFSGILQSWFPAIHLKTFGGSSDGTVQSALQRTMRSQLAVLGASFAILGASAPSAAAQSHPTMNQPDNGFYEGPAPEWAALHSTDADGTATHRQYHRDGVQAHIQWHELRRSEQGTSAYVDDHRLVHQERNEAHRAFHTTPTNP